MPSCFLHLWPACTNLALFLWLSAVVSAACTNIPDASVGAEISVDDIDLKTVVPKLSWSARIRQATLRYEEALKTALLFVACLALVILAIRTENKAGEKKELKLEVSKLDEKKELKLELQEAREELKQALLKRAASIKDLVEKEKKDFMDRRRDLNKRIEAFGREEVEEKDIKELKKRLCNIMDRERFLNELDKSRRAQEKALEESLEDRERLNQLGRQLEIEHEFQLTLQSVFAELTELDWKAGVFANKVDMLKQAVQDLKDLKLKAEQKLKTELLKLKAGQRTLKDLKLKAEQKLKTELQRLQHQGQLKEMQRLHARQAKSLVEVDKLQQELAKIEEMLKIQARQAKSIENEMLKLQEEQAKFEEMLKIQIEEQDELIEVDMLKLQEELGKVFIELANSQIEGIDRIISKF